MTFGSMAGHISATRGQGEQRLCHGRERERERGGREKESQNEIPHQKESVGKNPSHRISGGKYGGAMANRWLSAPSDTPHYHRQDEPATASTAAAPAAAASSTVIDGQCPGSTRGSTAITGRCRSPSASKAIPGFKAIDGRCGPPTAGAARAGAPRARAARAGAAWEGLPPPVGWPAEFH